MSERPPDRLYPADWQDSPRYSGAYTFMRCPTTRDLSLADVAIIGVPIDTDVMYRPGARFGPRAIRDASGQLRPHALDAARLEPPFDRLRVVDWGDAEGYPGYIDQTLTRAQAEIARIVDSDTFPVILGGDHSTTLAAVRACAAKHGTLSLVHFDAHPDFWKGAPERPYHHGTVFRVAVEEGLIDPAASVQVGIRGSISAGIISEARAAGFHLLVPFLDVIRYRHTLKEQAVDIPEQICITRDNVQVGVDGILYLKVLDAQRASYGIADYGFAITQLAQTALRSEVGKIDLDRTFEERTHVNSQVVTELDKASSPWGIKVLRYEIKNITPPKDVLAAMEKQMRAEREKRAVILTSEGERDAAINTAEGHKQQVIKESEAKRQQQINEAEGQANAILAVAEATGEGLRKVAAALASPGGIEAMQLRVAEQYVKEFGNLARTATTLVLPATLSDVGSMIALATKVIQKDAQPMATVPRPAAAGALRQKPPEPPHAT